MLLLKEANYHLYFLVFFVDLYYELKRNESEVIFYTIDLVLGGRNCSNSQQNLNRLELYCSRNYLNVNIGNTYNQV